VGKDNRGVYNVEKGESPCLGLFWNPPYIDHNKQSKFRDNLSTQIKKSTELESRSTFKISKNNNDFWTFYRLSWKLGKFTGGGSLRKQTKNKTTKRTYPSPPREGRLLSGVTILAIFP
jgi:hypothetical protein